MDVLILMILGAMMLALGGLCLVGGTFPGFIIEFLRTIVAKRATAY